MSIMFKNVLREIAVFSFGALFAMTVTHLIFRRASQALAWASLASANQYQKENEHDRAVYVLAQAAAADPNFYGSYELLGDIFAQNDNQQLALEMYQKALGVFDQEEFLPRGPISASEKASIRAKIDSLEKRMRSGQRNSSQK